jgi:outer membrane protein assembly factor BamA
MGFAASEFERRRYLGGIAATALTIGLSSAALADSAEKQAFDSSSDEQTVSVAPRILETPDTRIGTITITSDNIFDLEDPKENTGFYRFANKLHITTRPQVIGQQLLFSEGDEFSTRTLEESERLLRENRYIQEAEIEPVQRDDGIVDVNVHTRDVWTLGPALDFSSAGGENSSGVGLKEMNLFGTGIGVEASYRSDVDRDSNLIKIVDHHVRGSWYSLRARYAQNTDGHARNFVLQKPFYSLDSTNARGLKYLDENRVDSLYDHGEILAQFRHREKYYSGFYGWSKGLRDNLTRRFTAGLVYDQDQFSAIEDSLGVEVVVPDDRELLYPFIGIEIVQDKFEESKNYDQINQVEDRFMGARVGARLGLAQKEFGSDRDAWIIDVDAQTAFGDSRRRALVMSGELSTRVEQDGVRDLTLDVSARYDNRQSEKHLFYASLTGTYGHNIDADHQLLLGGDSGLRGYPLRYQTGDKRVLLTLEQRFFTDWYPFRLIRVGGAIFFDAGRTWGDSAITSQNEGVLKDIGVGLRLGTPRSGLGQVIHVDLAYPLDGDQSIKSVQFLVETKSSF